MVQMHKFVIREDRDQHISEIVGGLGEIRAYDCGVHIPHERFGMPFDNEKITLQLNFSRSLASKKDIYHLMHRLGYDPCKGNPRQ